MQLPFPHQIAVPLSNFSTFGIGGPAKYFALAHSCEDMQQMLGFANMHHLRVLIIGKGSNCLFDDRGFDGLAILNRIDYLEHEGEVFHAGSGYSFARLGQLTARLGWSGLEFAAGIPATVGGAVYMNAGANGKQTADMLYEVEYVTEKGELMRLKKEEMSFGYRSSPFQDWKGAIVSAKFHLMPSSEAKVRQKELLNYRLKTQPYGDKSAGCVFRNPSQASAGQLIEKCGLKGKKMGGAEVSLRHANFIINADFAKAQDVLSLLQIVKQQVEDQTGITLEEEIRYIPYE